MKTKKQVRNETPLTKKFRLFLQLKKAGIRGKAIQRKNQFFTELERAFKN